MIGLISGSGHPPSLSETGEGVEARDRKPLDSPLPLDILGGKSVLVDSSGPTKLAMIWVRLA